MGPLREAHKKFLVIDATFSCLTGLIGGSSVKKIKWSWFLSITHIQSHVTDTIVNVYFPNH